jgi:hypothetical protein
MRTTTSRAAGLAAVLAVAPLAACYGPPAGLDGPADAPSLAAGGKVDQTSRARYSFADSVDVGTLEAPQWAPAGFRGDGRLRDGSPATGTPFGAPANEYQGEFCGVNAVIGSGTGPETANFNYDPDMRWTSALPSACQPARHYRVYLNGAGEPPGVSRPHQIVADVATMAVGQTRVQPLQSGTLGDLGVGLWFDDAYPPASSVQVTRLPDVVDGGRTVRQWRLESRGSHRAMGVAQSTLPKRELVPTGTTYYLPFAMTVTEVPYPYPTFP